MNILLTTFCNRQCPYCFAKSKLQDEATARGEVLTLGDLAYALDFLKRGGETSVQVLGGEPTLHPQFAEAFSMVIAKKFSSVNLFTNGLISAQIRTFLEKIRSEKWDIVLNLNAPGEYSGKQWRTVETTAKAFGRRVSVSYNVYKPKPDMDFIVKFMERNKTSPVIRVGLALPIFGGTNVFVGLKDYRAIARVLVRFVEKNYEKGISIELDCGFTLCSFTDEQLGKLYRFGTRLNFTCGIPLDLGPGLRVWKCFPTSKIWNKRLTDFKDLREIQEFYSRKTSVLRQIGAGTRCFRCSYLKLGLCAGGCLGHTLRAMKAENRIERMA